MKRLPLNIDRKKLTDTRYAIKYSQSNKTCDLLRFELNIMKSLQAMDNMAQYYLTNLHPLIPYLEFEITNNITRVSETRCLLIMEQVQNVKTLEHVIKKKYPPSFTYDNGLLSFVINCYNDLMIGLHRLWLFNYYHIQWNISYIINGMLNG